MKFAAFADSSISVSQVRLKNKPEKKKRRHYRKTEQIKRLRKKQPVKRIKDVKLNMKQAESLKSNRAEA